MLIFLIHLIHRHLYPALTFPFAGSNSIEHFDLRFLQGPITTIGFATACDALHDRTALQATEILCEDLLRLESRTDCLRNSHRYGHRYGLIASLIRNDDIRILRFNLNRLHSTAYRPSIEQLEFLKDFYNHIKWITERTYRWDKPIARYRGERKIFINGVRVDLRTLQFRDYQFDLALVDMHRYNHVCKERELDSCLSVSEVRWMELPETFELNDQASVPIEPAKSDKKDGLAADKRRFAGLMWLYPNLRVVILENPTKQPIKKEAFLAFLDVCRALTELRLVYPGFPTSFYTKLLELASVASLHRFTLIEPFGFSAVRTFTLPNSRCLRRVHTNLATRTMMLKCVLEQMQMYAEFEFQFWHTKDAHMAYHYRFRKLDTARWDVLVEKENLLEPDSRHAILGGTVTYEGLLIAGNQPHHIAITSHWLDHLMDRQTSICHFI